jgi:hypothetical protein
MSRRKFHWLGFKEEEVEELCYICFEDWEDEGRGFCASCYYGSRLNYYYNNTEAPKQKLYTFNLKEFDLEKNNYSSNEIKGYSLYFFIQNHKEAHKEGFLDTHKLWESLVVFPQSNKRNCHNLCLYSF